MGKKDKLFKWAGFLSLLITVVLFTIVYDEYAKNLLRMFNIVVKVIPIVLKPVLVLLGIAIGLMSITINGLFKGTLKWFLVVFSGFYIFWLFLNPEIYWFRWYKSYMFDLSLQNAVVLFTNGALVGLSCSAIWLLWSNVKDKDFRDVGLGVSFVLYLLVSGVILENVSDVNKSPKADLLRFRQAIIEENFGEVDKYIKDKCYYVEKNADKISISCCGDKDACPKKPVANFKTMIDSGIFKDLVEISEKEILGFSRNSELKFKGPKNTIELQMEMKNYSPSWNSFDNYVISDFTIYSAAEK